MVSRVINESVSILASTLILLNSCMGILRPARGPERTDMACCKTVFCMHGILVVLRLVTRVEFISSKNGEMHAVVSCCQETSPVCSSFPRGSGATLRCSEEFGGTESHEPPIRRAQRLHKIPWEFKLTMSCALSPFPGALNLQVS